MSKNLWADGFNDGVLSVLTVITYAGDADSTIYREIVLSCGEEDLIARARSNGEMRSSGLTLYLKSKKFARPSGGDAPA